jgi:hypothetical protein
LLILNERCRRGLLAKGVLDDFVHAELFAYQFRSKVRVTICSFDFSVFLLESRDLSGNVVLGYSVNNK